MNITENTARPKLKLNFGTKPLILNTNANPNVVGSALKKVVVFEKPKSDVKDTTNLPATSDNNNVATDATKSSSKAGKNSKKQELAANQKVVAVALTPAEILKEKIKRHKKEYFSILTKLQADFPALFSEELKPHHLL